MLNVAVARHIHFKMGDYTTPEALMEIEPEMLRREISIAGACTVFCAACKWTCFQFSIIVGKVVETNRLYMQPWCSDIHIGTGHSTRNSS